MSTDFIPTKEYVSANGLYHCISYSPSKLITSIRLTRIEMYNATRRTCEEKKIMRKYFSKKITNLTAIQLKTPYYLKNCSKSLKTLKLVSSFMLKSAFMNLKALNISDTYSTTNLKGMKARKLANSNKRLETLIYKHPLKLSFLKSLRLFRQLRNINIQLNEDQILKHGNIIYGMKALRSANLSITGTSSFKTSAKLDQILNFFKKIITLQYFETLILDLDKSRMCKDDEFIENLLLLIQGSKLKSYNLKIAVEDSGPIQVEKLKLLFDGLNYLSLRNQNAAVARQNIVTQSVSAYKKFLEEISHAVARDKKCLDFLFQEDYKLILSQIIAVVKCSRHLEKLYTNLKETGEETNILKDMDTLKNLSDFIFDFENLSDNHVGKALIGMSHIVKNNSNLESLTLSDSNPWIYTTTNKNKVMQNVSKILSNSTKLKALNIDNLTLNVVSLDQIQDLLSNSNLEKVNLAVRTKTSTFDVNLSLPLEKLCNLRELSIKTPASLTPQSTQNLLLNFVNLKKLQKLKIETGTLFPINLDQCIDMLRSFYSLKDLKEISISLSINSNEVARMNNVSITETEPFIIANIKSEVKNLFNHNPNLTSVRIYQPLWFEIKAMK